MSHFHPPLVAFIAANAASVLHAPTNCELRHENDSDEMSTRNSNLGQPDGPYQAGLTGFLTTPDRPRRGLASYAARGTSEDLNVWISGK